MLHAGRGERGIDEHGVSHTLMSSKLLSATRRLLDDRAVEGNPVILKDEACHTWLRDTPLKALHPNRQAKASRIIPALIHFHLSTDQTLMRRQCSCSHVLCLGASSAIALVTLQSDGAAVVNKDIQHFPQAFTPSEHITAIQWACFAKCNASRWESPSSMCCC